jgi:hypothetical protein
MAGRLAAAAVAAGLALAVTACGQASPAGLGARQARPAVAAAISDPLSCTAGVTNKHPRDHHTVGVRVQTVPHARVVTVAHFKKAKVRKAHRAGPAGRHTAVYPLYSAAPGFRVAVNVYVFRDGRRGTCTTSFTPRGAAAPGPGPTPTPTPSPPPSGLACTASMSNSTPAQHSVVDVDVSTSPAAAASATAHYKTTNTTHNGTADSSGDAAIPFNISDATIGFQVNVDVTVTLNGQSATCSTSFTPTS